MNEEREQVQGTVAFCCDAGVGSGSGHVMRGIALAEELVRHGLRPLFFADVEELPFVREQLDRRGYAVRPPVVGAGYAAHVLAHGPRAIVVDSYSLRPVVTATFMAAGVLVFAIVDGDLRGQVADVYVDQNLGADGLDPDVPLATADKPRLAGIRYAMLRDDVLAARGPVATARAERAWAPVGGSSLRTAWRPLPEPPARDPADGPLRVLVVPGGTDPYGAGPVLAGALAATGEPFEATVIAPRAELADAIRAVPVSGTQRLDPVAPTDRLPSLVAAADLVLAAAGTATWEVLCLGVPAALVHVADNQRDPYARTLSTRAVAGLGGLDELRADPAPAVATLTRLLADPAERSRLAAAGPRLVDGFGRERVAQMLVGLLGARDLGRAMARDLRRNREHEQGH